jgi:hypothetical protein
MRVVYADGGTRNFQLSEKDIAVERGVLKLLFFVFPASSFMKASRVHFEGGSYIDVTEELWDYVSDVLKKRSVVS